MVRMHMVKLNELYQQTSDISWFTIDRNNEVVDHVRIYWNKATEGFEACSIALVQHRKGTGNWNPSIWKSILQSQSQSGSCPGKANSQDFGSHSIVLVWLEYSSFSTRMVKKCKQKTFYMHSIQNKCVKFSLLHRNMCIRCFTEDKPGDMW